MTRIQELREFVLAHTVMLEESTEKSVDMIFFHVEAKGEPDKAQLEKLVSESFEGVFGELNPFDGEDYYFDQIGSWLGEQEEAFRFMALAELVGLGKVSTPRRLLPSLSDEIVRGMAGEGYISFNTNIETFERRLKLYAMVDKGMAADRQR